MNAQMQKSVNNYKLLVLSKKTIEHFLFYLSVFFLGMGFHAVYVFLLFLFIMMKPKYLMKPSFKVSFSILFVLISLFLIPQYLIGYNQITVDHPLISMFAVMFSVVVYGLILQQMSPGIIKNSIFILILGIGAEALIIIVYSYSSNPLFYGYGLLYNPILNREVNSPGVALKIACLSALLIWELFQDRALYRKVFILLVVSLLVIASLWLASRAYFVIIFVSLSLSFILNVKLKSLFSILLLGLVGVISFYLLFQYFEVGAFSRVNRLDGSLESARFLLWKDGLSKLLSHPLGGFSVDQTIDPVRWFHNIFLDAGRLAGWIPVISLISFSFYSFMLFLQKRNQFYLFAGYMFVIVFMLMQQDVIVETMIRFLVLIYFCAILLGTGFNTNDKEAFN